MNAAAEPFRLSDPEAIVILTVAAIGLGDIWRLPSLALNHGGGAFLLAYVAALLLVGTPVLMAELAYGKLGGARFGSATRVMVKDLQLPRAWRLMSWTLPLAGLAVIALYGSLAGWSFGYVFRAASGASQGLDAPAARQLFLDLAADPERSMVWHTLFWLSVGVVSGQGWRDGIRRGAYWFGGLMLVLTLFLADELPRLGRDTAGAERMFGVRWDELGSEGVWAALTQACFTLSVGMGIIYVTGRRLRIEAHVARIALAVVAFDLVFGLVIGAAIASVVGGEPVVSSGVALVFVDLVVGLGDKPFAQLLFFCLLLLLSATSAVLLIEPFVQSVQDRFGCSRVAATGGVAIMAWLMGLIAILSFGPWQDVKIYGRGIVDWLVYLGVNILVPLNCLIIAGFVGRALPSSLVMAVSGSRLAVMGPWYLWLRFPVRLALVLVLLHSSGIIDGILEFFTTVPEDLIDHERG